MRKIIFIQLVVIMLLLISLISARTHTGPPDTSVDFLIDKWDELSFKDQRANETWTSYVNDYLSPSHTWTETFEDNEDRITQKCLSYAATTTNDWFKIVSGVLQKNTYQNFVNNRTENGNCSSWISRGFSFIKFSFIYIFSKTWDKGVYQFRFYFFLLEKD